MSARLGIIPIALLGMGCSSQLRPWTPSVSVAFWAEDVPAGRDFALPTTAELASRWKMAPASPWARYHKATLLSAADEIGSTATLPDVRRLDVVGRAEAAAARVAATGLPPSTMWMVDLRGAASAAFGARLSQSAREPIAPVVTFNNWPSDNELVPADETLAGLLAFAPRLPPPDENLVRVARPVFLLDAWRLAFRFDDPGEDVFDNRYMLTSSDFPSAEELHAAGVDHIVYVVEDLDDTEVEEDDLHATFRAWQAAGIAIYFVDLDFLMRAAPPAGPIGWTAVLAPHGYWTRDRYTLIDDPHFYVRARGGFGLASGRPAIHWGGGGSGHYGWGHWGGGGGGGGGGHGFSG